MQRVIQFSEADEARAIQILFRRFSGTILRDRVYIVGDDAAQALSDAGIELIELSRRSPSSGTEILIVERDARTL